MRYTNPRLLYFTLLTYRRQIACQLRLTYRRQIACQLRTQYVKGIYRSNYPWPWNIGQGHSRSLETEPLDRSYMTYY